MKLLFSILIFIISLRSYSAQSSVNDVLNFFKEYDAFVDYELFTDEVKGRVLEGDLSILTAPLSLDDYEITDISEEEIREIAKRLNQFLSEEQLIAIKDGFTEVCGFYLSDISEQHATKCSHLDNLYTEIYRASLGEDDLEGVYGSNLDELSIMFTGEDITSKLESEYYVDMELPEENEDGTVYTHDPSQLSDENIGSYRLKNSHLVKSSDDLEVVEIELVVCQLQNFKAYDFDKEVLSNIVESLEAEMLKEYNSLSSRENIYCTLEEYYTTTDKQTKIFEFLWPFAPEGIDLSCSSYKKTSL